MRSSFYYQPPKENSRNLSRNRPKTLLNFFGGVDLSAAQIKNSTDTLQAEKRPVPTKADLWAQYRFRALPTNLLHSIYDYKIGFASKRFQVFYL